MGWAINRIQATGCYRLTVGLRINENFSMIDSYIQVDRTHMRSLRVYVCNC